MVVKTDWEQLQETVDDLRLDIDVSEAKKLKEHAHSEVAFCLENDCAERAWENLFFKIDKLQERLMEPIVHDSSESGIFKTSENQ